MSTYNIKVRNFGFASDKYDSPDRYPEAPTIIISLLDQVSISDSISAEQEGVYNIVIQDHGFANTKRSGPGIEVSTVLKGEIEDSIGISDEVGYTEAIGYERNIGELIGISDTFDEECISYRKRISSKAEFNYYCTTSEQIEVVDGGSSGDGICRLIISAVAGTVSSIMLIPSNCPDNESYGYLRKLGIKFIAKNYIEYKYRTSNDGISWSGWSDNFTEDYKFYLKESSSIKYIEIIFTLLRDSIDDDTPELYAFEVEDCDSNLGEDFNDCYYKIYKLDSSLPIKKIAFQLSQPPSENTIYAIKAGTSRSSRMMTLVSKRIEETQLDSYGDDFGDTEIDEYKWWEPSKYSAYFDDIPQFITGGFGIYTVAEGSPLHGQGIYCKAGNTDGVWGHPAIISKFGINGQFEVFVRMTDFTPKDTNGYGATAYFAMYTRDAHTEIKTGIMAAIIQYPWDPAGTFKIKVYEWRRGVYSEIYSGAPGATDGFKFKREIAADGSVTLIVYKHDPIGFTEIVTISEGFTDSEMFTVFGIHLTGYQYEASVRFRDFDVINVDNIRPENKSASYSNNNHDLEYELPVAIYADHIGIFINPDGFSSNPITSFDAYEDQNEDLSIAIRETGFNIARAVDPKSRKYDLPHIDINVDDRGNRFDSIPENSRYVLQTSVLDNNYEIIESIQQAIIDGRTLKGREGDLINVAGESCSRINTNIKSSLVEAITPFYLFERFLAKSDQKELMIPSAFDLDKVGIRSAVNETIGESYMDLWGLNLLFSIDMLKETQPTKVIVWGQCEYLGLYPLGLGCIFSDGQYIYVIMFWKVLVEWIDNWGYSGNQYQYDIHVLKISFDGKPLANWSITQWHRDIFNSSPGFDRLNTLRQNVQYGLGLFGFKDDDYLFLLTPITHQAFWSDRPQRWQRIVKLKKSDLSYVLHSQYQRASDFHSFEALCELGSISQFGGSGKRYMLLFTGGYEEINIRYIEYEELFDNVNAPYILSSYWGQFPLSIGLRSFFPEYEGSSFEVDTIKDAVYDKQSNQYILNIRVRLDDSTFGALIVLRPRYRRYVQGVNLFYGMEVVSAKKVEATDTSESPFGLAIFPDKDIYCTRYGLRDIMRLIVRSFWLENGNILSRSYYNSHRNLIPQTPVVFLEEEIYANGEILDNTGEFDGTIKVTDDYILNLKTGEISLRKLYIESIIITGNYDYMHSLGYIEPSGNCWSVLQNIAAASNYLVRINEYGEVEMRDNRYYETLRVYTFTPSESQGYDPEITSTYGKVLRMKYVVFGDTPGGDLSSYDSVKVQNFTGNITYIKGTHYTLVKYADEVYIKWIATSVPSNEIPEFIVVSYLVQETIYQLDNRTEEIQRRITRDITGIANQITITGDKLFPAQLPAVAVSVFNVAYQISPGEGQIVSEIPTNIIYDDKQPLNVDAKFTLSFDSPVVLGTTIYHVDYADESQDYRSGFFDFERAGYPVDDFAHFAALNLTTAMPNTKYHVLINHPGPREFRLCTEDDRQDIIDAQESSWELIRDGGPVKSTWYIWIKWMNSKNFSSGYHYLHWHAYYLKRRTFWIDENGMVFESDAGDPNIQSIMKDKAIHVIVTPMNVNEAPLFDENAQEWPISWHEVLNINKVTLAQKGLNIEFTNNSIGFVPKLIKVEVIAYSLSHTERLIGYSQDMDSISEFGEKPESVDLPFGVNQEILSQVSKGILDHRKSAQKQFDVECIMIPQLEESDLIMLRSDDYRLYRAFKLSNRVSTKGYIAKLTLRSVPSSEISYS